MTLHEAIGEVQRVGSIRVENGKLKLRFPEPERARLEPAFEVLRQNRQAALEVVVSGNHATPRIETEPEPPMDLTQAGATLGEAGVRLMWLDGIPSVGVWSDTDGPEVRAALRAFGSGNRPVLYLDGNDVPLRYQLRWVPGEPVPKDVLHAMEQNPTAPWAIRDRMLNEMGWRVNGIPWREWKARQLNQLFEEHGIAGPGRIKAATVQHGSERRGESCA